MRTIDELHSDLEILEKQIRVRTNKDQFDQHAIEARECAEVAWDRLQRYHMGYAPAIQEAFLETAYRQITRGHVKLNKA